MGTKKKILRVGFLIMVILLFISFITYLKLNNDFKVLKESIEDVEESWKECFLEKCNIDFKAIEYKKTVLFDSIYLGMHLNAFNDTNYVDLMYSSDSTLYAFCPGDKSFMNVKIEEYSSIGYIKCVKDIFFADSNLISTNIEITYSNSELTKVQLFQYLEIDTSILYDEVKNLSFNFKESQKDSIGVNFLLEYTYSIYPKCNDEL